MCPSMWDMDADVEAPEVPVMAFEPQSPTQVLPCPASIANSSSLKSVNEPEWRNEIDRIYHPSLNETLTKYRTRYRTKLKRSGLIGRLRSIIDS